MNTNFFDIETTPFPDISRRVYDGFRHPHSIKVLINCEQCELSFASFLSSHEFSRIQLFRLYDSQNNSQYPIEYSCPYCNNVYHKTSNWIRE